jgi:hypothetical protein
MCRVAEVKDKRRLNNWDSWEESIELVQQHAKLPTILRYLQKKTNRSSIYNHLSGDQKQRSTLYCTANGTSETDVSISSKLGSNLPDLP